MIQFPKRSFNIRAPTNRRAPFFFKKVDLGLDGFKFKDFKEFKIHDSIKDSNIHLKRISRDVAINDLFLAYTLVSKDTITIIFRKNVEFSDQIYDCPEMLGPPHYLTKGNFKDPEDFRFYKFVKLTNSKCIKILFQSTVKKFLLNGDQLIVMLNRHVLIFSPLGTSVIDICGIDIAINRYLYILTKNQICIYDDNLIKTIDIDIKAKYIIPTTNYIFVTRFGIIYRIDDEKAEVFYECNAHIKSLVFDDDYICLSLSKGIVKINLHTGDFDCLNINFRSQSSISANKNLIVVSAPGSFCVFVKKDDFSVLNLRNLEIGMGSVFLYDNLILYSLDSEERIFEYKIVDDDLYPVEIMDRSYHNLANNKIKKSNDELVCDIETIEIDGISKNSHNSLYKVSSGYDEHSNSLSNDQSNFDFALNPQPFQLKTEEYDKCIETNDNFTKRIKINNFSDINQDVCFKPAPINKVKHLQNLKKTLFIRNCYSFYGSSFFNPKFSKFEKTLQFNILMKHDLSPTLLNTFKATDNFVEDDLFHHLVDIHDKSHQSQNISNISAEDSNTILKQSQDIHSMPHVYKISELMPSPMMTQPDTASCRTDTDLIPDQETYAIKENFDLTHIIDDVKNLNNKETSIIDAQEILKNRFKKIRDFIQKENLKYIEDSDSSSIEEKLFESEVRQSNILVDYLNSEQIIYKPKEENVKISALDFFHKIDQDFGIHNPMMNDQRLDCLQKPAYYSFIFAKSYLHYPKSNFFIPNFMNFFENYYRNRNEKEIEYKYQIYEFVNDEFKKIIGYKQNSVPASNSKLEIKRKKSGF